MKQIRTALDDGVELPTGRMSEVRSELVLQNREFRHCIVRNRDQRAGNGFVIVVDTLDGEVVISGTLATDAGTGACADSTASCDPCAQERKIQNAACN